MFKTIIAVALLLMASCCYIKVENINIPEDKIALPDSVKVK